MDISSYMERFRDFIQWSYGLHGSVDRAVPTYVTRQIVIWLQQVPDNAFLTFRSHTFLPFLHFLILQAIPFPLIQELLHWEPPLMPVNQLRAQVPEEGLFQGYSLAYFAATHRAPLWFLIWSIQDQKMWWSESVNHTSVVTKMLMTSDVNYYDWLFSHMPVPRLLQELQVVALPHTELLLYYRQLGHIWQQLTLWRETQQTQPFLTLTALWYIVQNYYFSSFPDSNTGFSFSY